MRLKLVEDTPDTKTFGGMDVVQHELGCITLSTRGIEIRPDTCHVCVNGVFGETRS